MSDVTLILLVSLGTLSAVLAGGMATFTARQSRLIAIMLKTNEGKTIGQHVEQFQEDQVVLRSELQNIAREKLKADAALAAASLEAIAKLTAASDSNMIETAKMSAAAVMAQADRTALLMTTNGKDEDPEITAAALISKAERRLVF